MYREINEMLQEYVGQPINNSTLQEVKYRASDMLGVVPGDVDVHTDPWGRMNVSITRSNQLRPVGVLGDAVPYDYVTGAARTTSGELRIDHLIEAAEHASTRAFRPDNTLVNPMTFKQLVDADSSRFKTTIAKIQSENRPQRMISDLQERIRVLEEELDAQKQDTEHYKMLAMEN
jgi:hypothetical protein